MCCLASLAPGLSFDDFGFYHIPILGKMQAAKKTKKLPRIPEPGELYRIKRVREYIMEQNKERIKNIGDFAKSLGFARQSSYDHIEKERGASLSYLINIYKKYNISASYILFGRDPHVYQDIE